MEYLAGYVKQEKEKKAGRHKAVASTGVKNRNRLVVNQDGWNLTNFHKNPILLFQHNPDWPVGGVDAAAVEGEKESKALMAEFHFNTKTTLGRELEALYADRDLRAVSVGFMPEKGLKELTEGEDDDEKIVGYESEKQELWELSAVAIPADPNALKQMKQAATSLRPEAGGWPFIEAIRAYTEQGTPLAAVQEAIQEMRAEIRKGFAALLEGEPLQGVLEHTDPNMEESLALAFAMREVDDRLSRI
jgi:HK97 family phage prohead protease